MKRPETRVPRGLDFHTRECGESTVFFETGENVIDAYFVVRVFPGRFIHFRISEM